MGFGRCGSAGAWPPGQAAVPHRVDVGREHPDHPDSTQTKSSRAWSLFRQPTLVHSTWSRKPNCTTGLRAPGRLVESAFVSSEHGYGGKSLEPRLRDSTVRHPAQRFCSFAKHTASVEAGL